ncbi:uncharacterized protein LOC110234463 [Exaiptasia diaphana]|uniref:Integrase catalytic domain-containing protein n=1 Tax=Exaiptasia diaphana TaxID=2652724 RepID=A0A913WX91_EXADI|nr:uncharacterized protein LOC110234463 [Exaiptasia diaphana]KXJ06312.1 putative uncharacterized transposon-derived protein F54H12.3 [Exaiptasia diaphana]
MNNDESRLSKIYYSTRGYWKGYEAINKLADAAKADLLFLTHDTVKRKTYKYALLVVDVASRYVHAEALTSKDSSGIAKAFERIYSRKLKWPNTVIVDPGTEFMGDVTKLMKKKGVRIQRSEAKNHKAQSVIERANRTLSERLYSHQYAQEMLLENERSREWVKRLPEVLEAMNNKPRRITGKETDKAVRLKEVDVKPVEYKRPVGLDEVRLPPGVKVRYLLAPGEDEGGDNSRATDPVWSLDIYDLSRSVVSVGQPVLYYLSEGGPRRGFSREELQVVPPDTELPPNSVLKQSDFLLLLQLLQQRTQLLFICPMVLSNLSIVARSS